MADWDPIETKTIDHVGRLGVPHEILECDPRYADTAAYCERYGYPLESAANTIVVATRGQPRTFAACVVSGTSRLANAALRRLLGSSRVSFASSDEMYALTGMAVGGVTVFGLPDDIPIYIEARLLERPYVILGCGGRHGKIKIAPQVFQTFPNARVVADLARPVVDA